jgi:nuclear transport factor 2 (NTF2) superfamily protein
MPEDMSANPNSRPPLPPFTPETAAQKARMAEDAWNDLPIKAAERKYHWPLGRRPHDHPGLSELGL